MSCPLPRYKATFDTPASESVPAIIPVSMQDSDKPVIFISCGQNALNERRLGEDICNLIRELRPDLEPYFAQTQSTLDGLSDRILKPCIRPPDSFALCTNAAK